VKESPSQNDISFLGPFTAEDFTERGDSMKSYTTKLALALVLVCGLAATPASATSMSLPSFSFDSWVEVAWSLLFSSDSTAALKSDEPPAPPPPPTMDNGCLINPDGCPKP
jgi:hypothetical protein